MPLPSYTYSGAVYSSPAVGTATFNLTTSGGAAIDFLDPSHIHVYTTLDGGATLVERFRPAQWDFNTARTQVTLVVPTVANEAVVIRRITPITGPLVDVPDGINLPAQRLRDVNLYNLYVTQEQNETSTAAQVTAQEASTQVGIALSSIASQLPYTQYANRAAVPTNPGSAVSGEVLDSTLMQTFTPLTGVPAGFVGSSSLIVRIRYSVSLATWQWIDYRAANADSRYLLKTQLVNSAVSSSTVDPPTAAAVKVAYDKAGTAQTGVDTLTAQVGAIQSSIASQYTIVGNVASIPAGTNGLRVDITNSTGIESFTPLTGRPSGFVGSTSLSVRLVYSALANTWQWVDYRAVDPDGRYAGINFTQSGTGAVARTVRDKLMDVVSVKDFGAIGNGVADDTVAIQAAIAASADIYFPAGTYRVASNTTIPATHSITLSAAASFTVNAGITLTIYAILNASPNVQLFTGAGTVTGISIVYPEWWGAKGDGVTDDVAAFQKASNSITASGLNPKDGTVFLQSKNYVLGSTWTIQQSANVPINVIGTGSLIGDTRLLSTSTFTGNLIAVEGSTDATQCVVDFTLKDFAVMSQNVARGVGIYFNLTGNNILVGLQDSLVENIYIDGFAFGMIVRNCRLINFRRIGIWQERIDGSLFANANYCLQVIDGSAGTSTFCGDLTFEECNFVTKKQYYSEIVRLSASSANASSITMAGIRFNQCVFYRGGGGSIKIIANNFSQISDIWFTNCQLDDTSGFDIRTSSANALISNLNFTGNYFTACTQNLIKISSSASVGKINAINISENYSAGVFNAAAVYAEGVHNMTLCNNRFSGVDWAIGCYLQFASCSHLVVTGNSAGRAGTALVGAFVNFINLSGTGNYYVITGNNSVGLATGTLIANTTGAANTAIANNI